MVSQPIDLGRLVVNSGSIVLILKIASFQRGWGGQVTTLFLLHTLSPSWVKTRLHTKNKLPRMFRTA